MKYDRYRDSKIEWIGEIPEHWEVRRFKLFSDLYTGNSIPDDEKYIYEEVSCGRPYIATKDVNLDFTINYNNGMKIPLVHSNFKIAPKNSSLMCIEGGSAGVKKAFVKKEVNFGNKLCCFNIKKDFLERYVYYFLCSSNYEQFFNMHIKGLIGGVNIQILKNFECIMPNYDEQKTIVKYLDNKTTKIDYIINSLENQKEKLELYKRELIAEVVTKGLDKNATLKDSGVDWIGQVPEHWGIERIKWNFEIVKRQDGREERPVLSITQQGIKIKDIDKNDGQMAASYEKYQLVEVGDYAMNSMDLLTGWIDCSIYEGVTSPDYRVFRLKDASNHSREYFNYLFQMCYIRRIFYRLGQGVSNLGRWRLQREPFLNTEIPIPPKEEQKEISAYIFQKESEIKKLKDKIQLQIEKLKGYRKIVIHDAVTGKVKVSGGEF
ncbi:MULTISPECIES: restriction endonuclease subunit S [Anaerococcus]|jgi:type I restriction modification DNA specificity domain protein|uniref:restriction endonuclease subunit S n=1 Tax=Anaerococcus TaxID=165779 RepID=UPI0029029FCD|nr:restriction endonuclease subunit S [Anaerococcus sp.]MDU2598239.1 restriction endonuclease subunit S [Anaerococcus sp.]